MNPFFAVKPEKIKDIVGQDKAISEIDKFLTNFKRGKGLFLHGPYGTGKTSSVYAFAKEKGYDILELNASDSRNQTEIKDFLSRACGQMSLFATKKIILLDELDGLSGMQDRGASTVISSYMESSAFPIIVTAFNAFEKKVAPIKKVSQLIEFSSLETKDIQQILRNVAVREKIKIDEKLIEKISQECGGDARIALNDYFSETLSRSNEGDENSSERTKTESITNALIRVLKSKDSSVFLGAYNNIDEDLDKIFLWLDENLPHEYSKPEDLAKAYSELSRGNIFFGRITHWQYYRFYVYCYQILSAGIALAKKVKYPLPPKYKQPMRLLKYWQANISYAKRNAIVEKIAEKTNISTKKALKNSFPTLIVALINDKDLIEEFNLSKEEISWLKKYYDEKK